eukprot:CFRG0762T1
MYEYTTSILFTLVSISIGAWFVLLQRQSYLLELVKASISAEANGTENRHPVLVLIAHPDDECMFFAPSILAISKSSRPVHVLCLSTGNYAGLGSVRSRELVASCEVLGVPVSRCTVLDDKRFQDGPNSWDKKDVAEIVSQYVHHHKIDTVLTFDFGGISGHPNHISCCEGVRFAISLKSIPNNVETLALESIGLVRKYSGLLDIPLTSALSDGQQLYIASPFEILTAQRAMQQHDTQFIWFRKLYTVFSRYMYINTYINLRS